MVAISNIKDSRHLYLDRKQNLSKFFVGFILKSLFLTLILAKFHNPFIWASSIVWEKVQSKCVFPSLLRHHRCACSNMDFINAETFLSFLAFSYSFVVDPHLFSPASPPLFWCFLALPSPWRNAPLLMISMWKRAVQASHVLNVPKRSRKCTCLAFNIRAC